jgi:hypothetical protein
MEIIVRKTSHGIIKVTKINTLGNTLTQKTNGSIYLKSFI